MPSFSDSIFLFILALLLFGPKKLPMLARELGKWVGEFRRASNEFKMQMEEELRLSEQADRQKQIAAMEAAAPVAPALPETTSVEAESTAEAVAETGTSSFDGPFEAPAAVTDAAAAEAAVPETTTPLPIATSGELNMMPPATGLPVGRGSSMRGSGSDDALGGLIESIPEVQPLSEIEQHARENALHGD
jgi:sec-independent protein translocase protein TatB